MAKIMKVRVYFTRNLLATAPNNENLIEDYIAKDAAPDDREAEVQLMKEMHEDEDLQDIFEKQLTVFYRTKSGEPVFLDHQWKGYCKEKCSFIRKNTTVTSIEEDVMDGLFDLHVGDTKIEDVIKEIKDSGWKPSKKTGKDAKPISAGIKAFKKEIDGSIFFYPEMIPIKTMEEIDILQRPLRAETAQGPRVALSASEQIHNGSYCDMMIKVNMDSHVNSVREWLNYGYAHGTGQWRNSGAGRFLWAELDREGNQIGGNYRPLLFQMLCEEDNM